MTDTIAPSSPFGEGYYLRGEGSNYHDYRWLPQLTIPACQKIAHYLNMQRGDSVLDCGCARGYFVRAFRELGYKAFGFDASEWAIENCDESVSEYVSLTFPERAFDWATLKDLGEHLSIFELSDLMEELCASITKGMLFVVPLTATTGGRYLRDEDEADTTHQLRWNLNDWIDFLEIKAPDFNVNASYHLHGMKPASAKVKHSCGFLTLIRP